MDETKRSILVGLFMIAAITALGGLVIVFGENPGILGGKRYQVIARFDDIEGVSQGTRVLMRGITIGEIERLELVDPAHPEQGVDVILRIDDEFPLPQNAEARVESSMIGLSGQAAFSIEIPTEPADPLPKDGRGRIQGRLEQANILPDDTMQVVLETLEHISTLAKALKPVADDMHLLFEARPIDQVDRPTTQSTESAQRLTANVSTAIERLNDVLKNFNDVIGDPTVKTDLRKVVSNLAAASRDLKQIAADLKPFPAEARKLAETGNRVLENLDQTVDNANAQVTELGKTLKGTLGQLEGVLKNFDRIARSIADGEGSAGKFVRDERLYESLLLTVDRLKKAIAEFQVLIKKWQEKGLSIL